ncbi:MAG: cyanophycin synthetase, partial [Pseudomonadota bacterium]
EDHHILTADQMRTVLRTQVDVVLPGGCAVLNADDELCAGLAELCDGDVVFYTQAAQHPALPAHCEQGRRFVAVDGDRVVLHRNRNQSTLLDLSHPVVRGLLAQHIGLSGLLAVTSAALALDIPLPLVRAGLETADRLYA